MGFEFTVLASGSSGNASLVRSQGFGLLLDIGLGPRQLAGRLAAIGASWGDIDAALLTHTHSDHWNDATLTHLRRRRVPLYCHAEHHAPLLGYGSEFAALLREDLVHNYDAEVDLLLAPGVRCSPLPVKHDGGATFGFRLEMAPDLFGSAAALGYAADLGCWDPQLAQGLADVDVLALEFNHDVHLEQSCGRSPQLVRRVLGDHGHLSNTQAAALLREVVRLSATGRPRHVVQLHLSRDCNRRALALEAARLALGDTSAVEVHVASQDRPGPSLTIGKNHKGKVSRRRATRRTEPVVALRPWLPGFEPKECDTPPLES